MDPVVYRIQMALQQLKRNLELDSSISAASGVTRPQMFMMYAIDKRGRCNLTQLAEQMEVKPSAITVMIDRLEKAGFVKRTHDTVDRRSIFVEMTASGKVVLQQAIEERNTVLKRYLSRLKQEEVVIFTELLEKVAEPTKMDEE